MGFDRYLIEVSIGKALRKASFDETQRSLTKDIRGARILLKKAVKWLSAAELAGDGVEEVFKEFPL